MRHCGARGAHHGAAGSATNPHLRPLTGTRACSTTLMRSPPPLAAHLRRLLHLSPSAHLIIIRRAMASTTAAAQAQPGERRLGPSFLAYNTHGPVAAGFG